MENYPYEQVIGSAAAPYINSLINSSALMTNSHAVSHPSEPNYLALFSGSTQGMSSDACPVSFSGANLATELAAHGDSFAGYAENLPADISACFADKSTSVSSGYMYWRKHVPWVDFTNVPAADSHAYTSGSALAGTVNFVVPNICHDMHDCGVGAGDAWLAQNVPGIQSYDSANKGLLIVTFDEGENGSNHIVTLFNGPMVHTGKYSQPIDHYSVLRLIESTFGLQLLGKSATASSIKGVLNNP
jgi:acid phosphatase